MEEKTYPEIKRTPEGFTVKINQKTTVPGFFTTYCQAERAVARHNGLKAKGKAKAKQLAKLSKEKRANG